MSGTTPYASLPIDVAGTCRNSAAEIVARLHALRAHLASLDPARLSMPGVRLEDLLAGFDIYTRMLADAMNDIATELEAEVPRRSQLELTGGTHR